VERNFHIFYQLFAGLSTSERDSLRLTQPSDFSYLHTPEAGSPLSPSDIPSSPDVPDTEQFIATQAALSTVNVDRGIQRSIFRLLAGILHLGNIRVRELRGNAEVDVSDPALRMASSLLGIVPDDLRLWMIKRQISARSERILTSLNSAQSASVRDSIAKFVYSRLFDWLTMIVNESLAGEEGLGPLMAESFIGILDIYGFEFYPESQAVSKTSKRRKLVNSFEQFCINYANERLQHEVRLSAAYSDTRH
jgi:myosin-5